MSSSDFAHAWKNSTQHAYMRVNKAWSGRTSNRSGMAVIPLLPVALHTARAFAGVAIVGGDGALGQYSPAGYPLASGAYSWR